MLRLDAWNLIFTIINILVLYVILRKFLMKPVSAIIQKRQDLIQNELSSAQQQSLSANELKKSYEEKLRVTKQEAAQIIMKARQDANTEADAIIAKATESAKRIEQKAYEKIERERDKLFQDMKQQIAALALAEATKIIQEAGEQNARANR